MKRIKAIETQYKGYLFRSRIEARFALFFDVLGIEWEYEKEGFDCKKAGWYLPDFYLPESKWFVEIKGGSITKKDKAKINYLDNHPPEYALGCLVLMSKDLNPGKKDITSHPWTVFGMIMDSFDKNEVIHALDVAKSARFDHKNSNVVI